MTVGDSVNAKPDGTPYRMVGIPDGLGAFDNGDGTFTDVIDSPVNAEHNSLCVAAGDLDGDGWPELVYCAGKSGDPIRTLTYKNDHGSFVDTTAQTPYQGARSRNIKIVDLNKDGRMDLLIVEQSKLKIWLNSEQGLPSKPSYTRAIAQGRDVAVGDVVAEELLVCGLAVLHGAVPVTSDLFGNLPGRGGIRHGKFFWSRRGKRDSPAGARGGEGFPQGRRGAGKKERGSRRGRCFIPGCEEISRGRNLAIAGTAFRAARRDCVVTLLTRGGS